MKLKINCTKISIKIYTITLNEWTCSKCKTQKKSIFGWEREFYLFIIQTLTNLATRHSLVMLLMPKFITFPIYSYNTQKLGMY